jgi:transcriptional regulator with XRE-family HTH domain
MSRRSKKPILTKEGQVLKNLREKKHQLTLKQVSEKTGLSDTMVSFIENGRAELPKSNETLDKLLRVYGGISKKYFYELVREFKEDEDDLHYLSKVLSHLSPEDIHFIRQIVDIRLRDKRK